MTGNWFTDREREILCVNAECSEHGDGSESCDIPAQQSDSPFDGSGGMLGRMDAEVLQPTVITRTEGDE